MTEGPWPETDKDFETQCELQLWRMSQRVSPSKSSSESSRCDDERRLYADFRDRYDFRSSQRISNEPPLESTPDDPLIFHMDGP